MPAGVAEFFLTQNVALQQAAQSAGRGTPSSAQCVYHPALLAQAKVRFLERKYGVDQQVTKTALVINPDRRGVVRWQDFSSAAIDETALAKSPAAGAGFAALEPPLNDGKILKGLEKDFQDWAYHESTLTVKIDPAQKGAAGPQAAIDKKLDALRQKLEREQLKLQQDESEVKQRALEELGTGAENLLGIFTGRRRRLTTSLTKRRLTSQAQGDVDESKQRIAQLQRDIDELKKGKAAGGGLSPEATEITLTPAQKDVYVELFGVAWVPYYRLPDGTEWMGYSAQ